MNLYTVIFEFMGGTYCSQNYSANEEKALLNALKENIENKELIDFKEDLLNEFNFWVEEIGVSPLDGLVNIWYFSFSYEDESYHCHIIKTVNL
ncbi:hypothetical protein [Chryseobacterium fistulae]|uniref:Uncharacterized protein n=1 Tax=Chryseobacterium fistulae TaxID=2675058 RepID=A0A6N4XL89_9FLAO|nr:hypothetical protein [Chryseobacterium fistulae]CAA7386638.1 hypothetical protein CHRY9393_00935 [Chryseobacterium fistulae]